MAYLDRREPGVYVDIEDVSNAMPTLETGRTVYSVILCDRGPSDQIVSVRSQEQFQRIFGKPNFLRTSQTHYMVDAALKYTGSVLVTRVVPEDSYWANSAIRENTSGEVVNAMFTFTADLKEVVMQQLNDNSGTIYSDSLYGEGKDPAQELDLVQIGSWIYAEGDDPSCAAQVVNRSVNEQTGMVTLLLDRPYGGSSVIGQARVFVPFSEISLTDINDANLLNNPEGDIVYYFYAFGAGKYYNRLVVRGTRNVDLEKYYIYEDGTPRYKYLFMD